MKNPKLLAEFLKELESANLIELKISEERLEIVANRFLTNQNLY
jgi:DNA-binding HxlR family transcriptional regulator